jgi:hypothetical protein
MIEYESYLQSMGTLGKCWMIHLTFFGTSWEESLRSSGLGGLLSDYAYGCLTM